MVWGRLGNSYATQCRLLTCFLSSSSDIISFLENMEILMLSGYERSWGYQCTTHKHDTSYAKYRNPTCGSAREQPLEKKKDTDFQYSLNIQYILTSSGILYRLFTADVGVSFCFGWLELQFSSAWTMQRAVLWHFLPRPRDKSASCKAGTSTRNAGPQKIPHWILRITHWWKVFITVVREGRQMCVQPGKKINLTYTKILRITLEPWEPSGNVSQCFQSFILFHSTKT